MDTVTDTHPNPQPDLHHRKIDLQSPHDLTYLQTNLAQSALQKLDLHFPKLGRPATHISLDQNNGNTDGDKEDAEDDDEDQDPMRRRVQDLVREFLTATWQSAGHNIAVNGVDASGIPIPHTATLSPAPRPQPAIISDDPRTVETEIEGIHFQHAPFDASLQHKLASLHGELEALTAQVSKLRRTAPVEGAGIQQERLRSVLDEDERRFREEREGDMDEESGVDGLDVQFVRDGWNRDVRESYAIGVGGLAALAGGVGASDSGSKGRAPTLTETVGKAQRARRVAMEME